MIGIIAILLGILLPVLEKVRERATETKCMSNLRSIGQCLSIYAGENQGNYPRTIAQAGAPPTAGTNAAAPNPFGTGGPAANDVSAAMFLLIRTQNVPPVLFTCPYTDEKEFVADPTPELANRSNFTNYKDNLGYSYANPYPDETAERSGYKLASNMSAQFPVAADLNPGKGDAANSRIHERRGQNVLYADGHASWEKSPLCGINGDNIYSTKAGAVWASPVDSTDSILLPSE